MSYMDTLLAQRNIIDRKIEDLGKDPGIVFNYVTNELRIQGMEVIKKNGKSLIALDANGTKYLIGAQKQYYGVSSGPRLPIMEEHEATN